MHTLTNLSALYIGEVLRSTYSMQNFSYIIIFLCGDAKHCMSVGCAKSPKSFYRLRLHCGRREDNEICCDFLAIIMASILCLHVFL